MKLQLTLAVIMSLCGLVLIFSAFILPPPGVIDSSVLVAFGEMLTFAGSLLGIDYHYKYKPNGKNDEE